MHRAAPPLFIRPLRLVRLFRWAWLWLIAYAPHFVSAARAPRVLQRMTRVVACLLFLSAVQRAQVRPTKKTPHPVSAPRGFFNRPAVNPGVLLRAAIGARLRRRLRGRSGAARVAALLSALWNADTLVEQLAKRVARRLTRMRPIVPVAPPAAALAFCALAPSANADTS